MLFDLLKFVISMAKEFDIDESHGLIHSMEVLMFSHKIYKEEVLKEPSLHNQKKIIYISALVHDMCDAKYIQTSEGIERIRNRLKMDLQDNEINIVIKIITEISYSKVKNGDKFIFPDDLGEFETAYHIVREADLLAAYDYKRALIFNLVKNKGIDPIGEANKIFENRVLKYRDDCLFLTVYGKRESKKNHELGALEMNLWNEFME
jgi:hypothetical protein